MGEPLTLAELLGGGMLRDARRIGAAADDRPVRAVRQVDRLEEIGAGVPHTAWVLSATAARGGWAVEAALRRAWERAAACVVAPAAAISSPAADLVATRLDIPLLAVDTDPRTVALELAAAVAAPEAARTSLVARCALRVSAAGPSARNVLGALNTELPGVQVALVDPAGELVAGRRAARDAWQAGADVATALVVGVDDAPLGRLVAAPGGTSPAQRRVVADVLQVAAGQVTGWAATARLHAERRPRTAAALLQRLLDHDGSEALLEELTGMGWPTSGRAVAVAVVAVPGLQPRDAATFDAELCSAWETGGPGGVLAPAAGAWIGFLPEAADTATTVADAVNRLSSWLPVAAGIGKPIDAGSGLAESVRSARAAAAVARQQGAGAVLSTDDMGVRSLLAALPDQLGDAAREALAEVLAVDEDGHLLTTLRAVLDAGGSVKDSSAALGVHRNTVAARLDRLRELGVDPADPQQRLALHLACHLLR